MKKINCCKYCGKKLRRRYGNQLVANTDIENAHYSCHLKTLIKENSPRTKPRSDLEAGSQTKRFQEDKTRETLWGKRGAGDKT